jgi:DNA-binding NarL/FixJ family response regulator
VLSGTGYEDQYHVPQATLDIDLALASGGPAAAVALAVETLDRSELSMSSPRYVWPLLVSSAAAAREASSDGASGDTAEALLERLRTLAEKLEAFGPVQRAWQLSFETLVPGVDAASGVDGRLAAADAAVAAWEAIGQPHPAAVALVYAARAALSGPAGLPGPAGREAAAARLRRAAPIAERLDARPLAEQIATLARQAGENWDSGGTRNGADRLGLTGREFEVLRLVAAGQSNREIAAALFISPKTASVHVSNILAKLGTATRTEAAAKAHALRLFEIPS